MKQHIDFEEVLKLSEDKLEILLEYFPPLKMNNYRSNPSATIHLVSNGLNIGKMIYLLNSRKYPKVSKDIELSISSTGYTHLGIIFDEYNNKKWFKGKELCDVLWEAIKDNYLK